MEFNINILRHNLYKESIVTTKKMCSTFEDKITMKKAGYLKLELTELVLFVDNNQLTLTATYLKCRDYKTI